MKLQQLLLNKCYYINKQISGKSYEDVFTSFQAKVEVNVIDRDMFDLCYENAIITIENKKGVPTITSIEAYDHDTSLGCYTFSELCEKYIKELDIGFDRRFAVIVCLNNGTERDWITISEHDTLSSALRTKEDIVKNDIGYNFRYVEVRDTELEDTISLTCDTIDYNWLKKVFNDLEIKEDRDWQILGVELFKVLTQETYNLAQVGSCFDRATKKSMGLGYAEDFWGEIF